MGYNTEQRIAVQQHCYLANILSFDCQKIDITSYSRITEYNNLFQYTEIQPHSFKTTDLIRVFFQILIKAAGEHHPQQLKKGNADSHSTKDMQLTQNDFS